MERKLSKREIDIIRLSEEGLKNDAIAHRLGITVDTVSTYWVRIRRKLGTVDKVETMVKLLKNRAENALYKITEEHSALLASLAEREKLIIELRSHLAMIHLSMNEVKATVWATDRFLKIGIIADGEFSTEYFGSRWTKGSSIHDLFKTDDPADTAIAAHHAALSGEEAGVMLSGAFANLLLRVQPLPDETGDIIGCISILNRVPQT